MVTAEGETAGEAPALPFVGVALDVGVPDGLGAGLVVTPFRYLRLHLDGLSNGVGSGVRFGVQAMALPNFPFRPFIAIDGGYVFNGVGAWLPQLISDQNLKNAISSITVGFVNGHVGFELGSKNVAITIRAGLSYVDLGAASQTYSTGPSSNVSTGALTLRGFVPSARVGLLFNFG